jgi:hypothetical protein
VSRRDRPHKLWPITVISLVLLWILLIFLLIHNGPRLPRWPATAAQVVQPQDLETGPRPFPGAPGRA